MAGGDAIWLWLWCVGASLAVSVVTFWGLGGLVHYWFYVRQRARAADWKQQPQRWLSPALSRHALLLGSGNLVLGSLLGGSFLWHLRRGGRSSLYFDAGRYGYLYLALSAVVVFFMIDAGLYYSHRLLHHRRLFRYIHRWHHRYVAPTVFTTTAMHPLEFVIFTAALLAPAFVIPVHAAVYAAVIGYTYFIGMLDHSGIRARWKLPFHSDNRFHDDHHVYFHCNYGHHTALWDRWHSTVRHPGRRYDEHHWGDAPQVKAADNEETEPNVGLSEAPLT